ncbi:uncharacterized protein LOC118430605 [Branchiostoma floridae]|uniref:Uncharacterized protein LOC118430605 n=1 Tax=Branchiostoma floridae TaxID=7739 RepID=A0A9J7MAN8_BRAFL|nr:uncharacterized protein LOC118430605 [Branchiostoma floridae]
MATRTPKTHKCECGRPRCADNGVCIKTKRRHMVEKEEYRRSKKRLGEKPPIAVFLEDDKDPRNEPIICDGSSLWPTLGFVCAVMKLRADNPGMSQECVTQVLQLYKRVLDDNNIPNRIPHSFKDAKSKLNDLLPRCETYDVCQNDCTIYFGENVYETTCPTCKEPRFDGNGKAKKEFYYFPLIETVKSLYGVPKLAQMLQQHASFLEEDVPRFVADIRETAIWKHLYSADGLFEGEARSLAFGYSTDGGEPNDHLGIPCSIWPLCFKIFNLDPEVRDKVGLLLLLGMTKGPKAPHTMNALHEPMVADILTLLEGVEVWDSWRQEFFMLKGDVQSYEFDWPARSKATNHQGHRATSGCPMCFQEAIYDKQARVSTFTDSRRHLPMHHHLRFDRENFPGKEEEHRGPPHLKTDMNVYGRAVDDLGDEISQKKSAGNKVARYITRARSEITSMTGKTGLEKLADIPTYSISRVHVDYMHTGKNIAHSMFEVLTGSKQNFEAIVQMEKSMGRFNCSSDSRTQVYQLSKEQIAEADRRLLTVKVPIGYDFKIRAMFKKAIGTKSIEWIKFFTEGLCIFATRDMLPPAQSGTLSRLCHTLQAIGSPVVDMESLPALDLQVHETFSLLERDFPIGFRTLMWHLPHHMVQIVKEYGPITGLWLTPFERYMKVHLSRMTSRSHPSKSSIEAHKVSFLCRLMEFAGKMPTLPDHFESGDPSELTEECEEEQGEEEDAGLSVAETSATTLHHLKGTIPLPVLVELDREQHCYMVTYVAENSGVPVNPNDTSAWKYFAATSRHPRTKRLQEYRCEEIEAKTSAKSISSVVGVVDQDCVYFGRIQYFVLFGQHEVPYIKWYGRGERDAGTKLWTVQLSGTPPCWKVNPFKPFHKITKPLVHATEDNKLFILDCHDIDL